MLQDMMVLSNHLLPANALDQSGIFHIWVDLAKAQNEQNQDSVLLRNRMKQTLAVEIPPDVIARRDGQSIVLNRPSKKDHVQGIWIQGTGKTASVVDPNGSAAALETEVVRRLKREGRTILMLDVFQAGAAKAPRADENPPGTSPDTDDEEMANAAAGNPKFLTFNISRDAARVQDIITAIAYLSKTSHDIEIFATGNAAVWSTFASAVSSVPVTLHLENVPKLVSDSDYLEHFNVPGIRRAGGIPVAEKLASGSK